MEVKPYQVDAKNQSIGIDLGIKTFAYMSDGEKAESPNYKQLDWKIRKLQRKLARQPKDSKRRNKTRIQIAKLHNQIADTRKDFLHKLSTKIVTENETIVLEDLNVSGMVKNRKLSRAISQQGWREFRTLCEAKSKKFGRTFLAINRWEPTSQIRDGQTTPVAQPDETSRITAPLGRWVCQITQLPLWDVVWSGTPKLEMTPGELLEAILERREKRTSASW